MTTEQRLEELQKKYAEELAAIREDFKDIDTLTALDYIIMKNQVALGYLD